MKRELRGRWKWLLALTLLSAIVFQFVRVRTERRMEVSGDEPHYLVMMRSLARDRDLDLANQYRARQYRDFRKTLTAHRAPAEHQGIQSIHYPGLPLLFWPLVELFDVGAVKPVMALLAAFGILQIALLCLDLGLPFPASLAATSAVAFSVPWLFYSHLVFPAIPTAVLVTVACRILFRMQHATAGRGWLLLYSLILAFLPWLHVRFVLFDLSLFLLILLPRFRPSRPELALLTAIPALSGMTILLRFRLLFGEYFPCFRFHPPVEFKTLLAGGGLFGPWLDPMGGILILAPILAIFPGGWIRLCRRHSGAALRLLVVFMPYVVFHAFFSIWYGGWCPPGRYLVPIIPLLTPAIAAGLATPGRSRRILFIALATITLVFSRQFAESPDLLYQEAGKCAEVLRQWDPSGRLCRLLPSFIPPLQPSQTANGIALTGWLLLSIVTALPARKKYAGE